MKLFGVLHQSEHLSRQVDEIGNHVDQGSTMLIELAPNYQTFVEQEILRPNFFMAIRDYFRSRCSRVICGDQELTIPKDPCWWAAALIGEDYFYPNNIRDEVIATTILAEKPDIVVVGNGHSDELKEQFPQAYYTVFQPQGGCTVGHHGRRKEWYRPNRIISL